MTQAGEAGTADMSGIDLNELITRKEREAFARMWPAQSDLARREMRWILDLLSKPASRRDEYQTLLRNLATALVGTDADLSAWVQAIAAGSFELRPEQRYALPGLNERPARFIDRGRKTYDKGTTQEQRKVGITDATAGDGINLVAISAVLKEFRNLVTGPRALGPAWPVFVSVDTGLSNLEHRQLHRFGADEALHDSLTAAIRSALATYIAEHRDGDDSAGESRRADWKSQLPPGTDPIAYFGRGSAALESYRQGLGEALSVQLPSEGKLEADAAAIKAAIETVRPTKSPFTYWVLPNGGKREEIFYTTAEEQRMKEFFPMLLRSDADDLMFAAATRAYLRYTWADRMITGHPQALVNEVRHWVHAGYPPPPDVRIEHVHLFEEEACYLYFNDPSKLTSWRKMLGLFPKARPEPSKDVVDWTYDRREALLQLQSNRPRVRA